MTEGKPKAHSVKASLGGQISCAEPLNKTGHQAIALLVAVLLLLAVASIVLVQQKADKILAGLEIELYLRYGTKAREGGQMAKPHTVLWIDPTVKIVTQLVRSGTEILGEVIEHIHRAGGGWRLRVGRTTTRALVQAISDMHTQARILEICVVPRKQARKKPVNITRERIEEMLDAKGWTQQELAKRADVGAGTISRLLSGSAEALSVENLVRIADGLVTTTDWLLGRE